MSYAQQYAKVLNTQIPEGWDSSNPYNNIPEIDSEFIDTYDLEWDEIIPFQDGSYVILEGGKWMAYSNFIEHLETVGYKSPKSVQSVG